MRIGSPNQTDTSAHLEIPGPADAKARRPRNKLGAAGTAALGTVGELEKLEERVLFATTPLVAVPLVTVNHAPTELSSGKLAKTASQSYPLSITVSDLVKASQAHDIDGNVLAFFVTNISTGKGNLTITHNGSTAAAALGTVIAGSDVLTWTPFPATSGTVNAFSVEASDGLLISRQPTAISILTRALPTVSMSVSSTDAWETQPAGHPAVLTFTRTGSTAQRLNVILMFQGTTSLAGKFRVIGPTGPLAVVGSGTTYFVSVPIAARAHSARIFFEAIEDNVADPTLLVTAALSMDGGATPQYQRSTTLSQILINLHIVDSSDSLVFTPKSSGIVEGLQNQRALVITRTPAIGGTLAAATLNLSFSGGTFSTANISAASTTGAGDARSGGVLTVNFAAGQATKTVFLSTNDNGSANGTQTILVTAAPGAGSHFVSASTAANPFTSTIKVLDAEPTVTVKANSAGIVEGDQNATAFTLTRTAAPGHSLVGVDTKVLVTFGGTFGASSHGFASSTLIDFGTSGATTVVVPISSTANATADGTKTITATLSQQPATSPNYTPVNVGAAATLNVADSMPSVTIKALGGITEGAIDQEPFILTRTAAPGQSLVGVDTKVALAFTGTFAASSHGFAQVQIVDFGLNGATSVVVPFQSTDNQVGNGTQTLIATLSGTASGATPFNVVGSSATANVTDASPTVTLTGQTTTATATGSTLIPGIIIVSRSGDVSAAKDVTLAVSTGSGLGVEGVDFNLFAGGQLVQHDIVQIPAGRSSVAVSVVPLNNHINDALKATITLPKNGAWNNGTTSSVSITLTNNDRAPQVGVAKVLRLVQRSGSLKLSFGDLKSLSAASLAPSEHGTLTLSLSTLPLGTAEIIKAGTTTATSAAAGATINAGDALVWIAPTNTIENGAPAFTIGATDGTVKSATTTEFDVSII